MITFSKGNKYFSYRAAAVFMHNNRVLLNYIGESKNWFLPGGRVEMTEPSKESVVREIKEELEVDATIGRLLWVNENLYQKENIQIHELGLYFLASFTDDHPLYQRTEPFIGPEILPDGATTTFHWHPVDQLKEITMYPNYLVEGLANLPKSTEYIISRR